MAEVTLKPFLRPGLDVLFVALNPSAQSNCRGHYFSGDQSRFFHLLGASGLTTEEVAKGRADELVFGGNALNYLGAQFGVVDLVDDFVGTDSSKVSVEPRHVSSLLDRVREYEPRFVCVIHSKVRDNLNSTRRLQGRLDFGFCGQLLSSCSSEWLFNYFSNGNNISDATKLALYRELRDRLGAGA